MPCGVCLVPLGAVSVLAWRTSACIIPAEAPTCTSVTPCLPNACQRARLMFAPAGASLQTCSFANLQMCAGGEEQAQAGRLLAACAGGQTRAGCGRRVCGGRRWTTLLRCPCGRKRRCAESQHTPFLFASCKPPVPIMHVEVCSPSSAFLLLILFVITA